MSLWRSLLLLPMLAGVILLGAPARPALADPTTTLGTPGAVYPVANDDIRLDKETVQAVLYRSFAEFHVDIRFVNEGDKQTVRLGFPFPVAKDGGGELPGFQAWQDGTLVEVSRGLQRQTYPPTKALQGYYLMNVTFPRGETTLTIDYLASPGSTAGRIYAAPPADFGDADVFPVGKFYQYWLHTGGTWKGPIGKVVVRFRLADSFTGWATDTTRAEAQLAGGGGPTTTPESYVKLDDRTYQWVFNNLEPTEADDIVFAFTQPSALSSGNGWDATAPFPESYGALAVVDRPSGGEAAPQSAGYLASLRVVDGLLRSSSPFPHNKTDMELFILGRQSLREVRLVPGKSYEAPPFSRQSGRPKTVQVSFGGTRTTVTLRDEPTLQRFPVSGQSTLIWLDVLDTYGAPSDETCFSEIELGTELTPEFETFAVLIEQQPGASGSSGSAAREISRPLIPSGSNAGDGSGQPTGLGVYGSKASPSRPTVFLIVAGVCVLAFALIPVVSELKDRRRRRTKAG
jgi:hypothetical protein